jgi:hypothetical protein
LLFSRSQVEHTVWPSRGLFVIIVHRPATAHKPHPAYGVTSASTSRDTRYGERFRPRKASQPQILAGEAS